MVSNGVGLLEVIVALTISVTILSIAVNSVSESSAVTRKLTANQQQLESIFFAVDMIKSDLTRCGMRLQEALKLSGDNWFGKTPGGFFVIYGTFSDTADSGLFTGNSHVSMPRNGFLKKNRDIVLYNLEYESFEKNQIKEVKNDMFVLKSPAKCDHYHPMMAVVLKRIEYKFDPKKGVLSRKVDRGRFQPLIENVSDFFIHYYEESSSVLYRIEVNRKEQIRGYIFLRNMVP